MENAFIYPKAAFKSKLRVRRGKLLGRHANQATDSDRPELLSRRIEPEPNI